MGLWTVQRLFNTVQTDYNRNYGITFVTAPYERNSAPGISSVPRVMEAARPLGMSYFQAMRYAIPRRLSGNIITMGNEFIALLGLSWSCGSGADLTRRGREFMSAHFNPIETWLMVALLYLIMTLIAARVVSYIEKRSKYER